MSKRRLILGSLKGNPLHPTVIEIFVNEQHIDRYTGRRVDDPPGTTNAYYKDLWKVRKTLPKQSERSVTADEIIAGATTRKRKSR